MSYDMAFSDCHHRRFSAWQRSGRNACLLAGVAAAASSGALVGDGQGATGGACGVPGYSYAGFQDAQTAHGIRATLMPLARPQVESGHVAAWVGVGGTGLGAGGSDAWIQIGLSSFSDGVSRLYSEVNQPSIGPRYTELATGVSVGARHRVVVLEVASRPGWWRVWLDGTPASTPLYLPGSTRRWRPIATAETWDGGRRVCNRFAYRFERVAVVKARGGSWTPFVVGHRFQGPGYRVLLERPGVFSARAAGW